MIPVKITRYTLRKNIVDQCKIQHEEADKFINLLLDAVKNIVQKDGELKITHFGIFLKNQKMSVWDVILEP